MKPLQQSGFLLKIDKQGESSISNVIEQGQLNEQENT